MKLNAFSGAFCSRSLLIFLCLKVTSSSNVNGTESSIVKGTERSIIVNSSSSELGESGSLDSSVIFPTSTSTPASDLIEESAKGQAVGQARKVEALDGKVKDLAIKTNESRGASLPGAIEDESTMRSAMLVIRLAQCRATCLEKKKLRLGSLLGMPTEKKMRVKKIMASYSDCWDTCLLLEIESGTHHPSLKLLNVVCSPGSSSCFSGCRDACKFHLDAKKEIETLSLSSENLIKYNYTITTSTAAPGRLKKGRRKLFHLDLHWPELSSDDDSIVYTIIQKAHLKSGWTWKMVEQTLKTGISLTFSVRPLVETLGVFGTIPQGLVVGSGQKVTSAVIKDKTKLIKVDDGHSGGQRGGGGGDMWHLRKVSMVHRRLLMLTEIAWDIPSEFIPPIKDKKSRTTKSSESIFNDKGSPSRIVNHTMTLADDDDKPKFLLTWQTIGGALQGNMITDANGATLSLHCDTDYVVQVGLIDQDHPVESTSNLTSFNLSQLRPKIHFWSQTLHLRTSDPSNLKSDLDLREREREEEELVEEFRQLDSEYSYSRSVYAEGKFATERLRRRCNCSVGLMKREIHCYHSCVSWLEILGSTYGILVLLVILSYLLYVYKNSTFCGHGNVQELEVSSITSTMASTLSSAIADEAMAVVGARTALGARMELEARTALETRTAAVTLALLPKEPESSSGIHQKLPCDEPYYERAGSLFQYNIV